MDENFSGQPNPLEQKPNMGNLQNQNMANPIRPMEQVAMPVPEPPKKKKTGLIAGIIIGVVALIGIAVAVVLILNSGDPVSKAMGKIIQGQTPENVAMNGKIELKTKSNEIGMFSATIELESQSSAKSLANATSANMNLDFGLLGSANLSIEEIYPSNGDLYLKVNGTSTSAPSLNKPSETGLNTDDNAILNEVIEGVINNIAEDPGAVEQDVEPNDDVAVSEFNSVMNSLGNTIGQLNGKWIKISLSDFSDLLTGTVDSSVDCATNLVDDIKNSSNTLAQIYDKNSFISSTTEGVTLASKNSKVYQVILNSEKLDNFTNEINNTNFAKNYKQCSETDEDVFEKVDISSLPNFYVELDNDYNFTRIYTSTDIGENGEMALVADVDFSYPKDLNISKPENAVDFVEVMQKFFESLNIKAEDANTQITTE